MNALLGAGGQADKDRKKEFLFSDRLPRRMRLSTMEGFFYGKENAILDTMKWFEIWESRL